MGATAATVVMATMSHQQARKQQKHAQAQAKLQAKQARAASEKAEAERQAEEAKLAASTPWSTDDTSGRIAAERAFYERRRSRGNRATSDDIRIG